MAEDTRPVPTQAENDALKTGQMHPDQISNPAEEKKQHYQPEERAPAPPAPAPAATSSTARRSTATEEAEKPAE